jgi:hypothetical protein
MVSDVSVNDGGMGMSDGNACARVLTHLANSDAYTLDQLRSELPEIDTDAAVNELLDLELLEIAVEDDSHFVQLPDRVAREFFNAIASIALGLVAGAQKRGHNATEGVGE